MTPVKADKQPSCRCCGKMIPQLRVKGIWDGESYRDAFFCSDGCAIEFAHHKAAQGHSMPGFERALDKRIKPGRTVKWRLEGDRLITQR